MTTFLDDLVAADKATAQREKATTSPAIVEFARSMRGVFGEGVSLHRDPGPWPGGCNVRKVYAPRRPR